MQSANHFANYPKKIGLWVKNKDLPGDAKKLFAIYLVKENSIITLTTYFTDKISLQLLHVFSIDSTTDQIGGHPPSEKFFFGRRLFQE